MGRGLVAKASIAIDAPAAEVWVALVSPEVIKRYMFGTTVVSDWREGSPIVWKGEWQGKPLSGLPDTPANYHTVTVELSSEGLQTLVSLSQDNNPTEQALEHSAKNWEMMLTSLKRLLEK